MIHAQRGACAAAPAAACAYAPHALPPARTHWCLAQKGGGVREPWQPSRGELPVNFVEGEDSPLEYLAGLDASVSGRLRVCAGWWCGPLSRRVCRADQLWLIAARRQWRCGSVCQRMACPWQRRAPQGSSCKVRRGGLGTRQRRHTPAHSLSHPHTRAETTKHILTIHHHFYHRPRPCSSTPGSTWWWQTSPRGRWATCATAPAACRSRWRRGCTASPMGPWTSPGSR